MNRFFCIFEDKECTGCNECEFCDKNSDKICDNCGECMKLNSEFRTVTVKKDNRVRINQRFSKKKYS